MVKANTISGKREKNLYYDEAELHKQLKKFYAGEGEHIISKRKGKTINKFTHKETTIDGFCTEYEAACSKLGKGKKADHKDLKGLKSIVRGRKTGLERKLLRLWAIHEETSGDPKPEFQAFKAKPKEKKKPSDVEYNRLMKALGLEQSA